MVLRKRMSEEHKRRLSELRKGKPLSDAHKKKISETKKGKKHTEIAKRKIGEAKRGKPLSDETKRKISEKLKEYWINVKWYDDEDETIENNKQNNDDK